MIRQSELISMFMNVSGKYLYFHLVNLRTFKCVSLWLSSEPMGQTLKISNLKSSGQWVQSF